MPRDAAPYHPAPKHHADPYKLAPRPFAYEYGVKDEYSGAYFDKKETQDEYGVVSGEYRVALPDGRTQIVTYHADHDTGYVADVRYEGEPHYEPHAPHKAAPHHAAPHHAPAPYHAPKPAPYHPAPAPCTLRTSRRAKQLRKLAHWRSIPLRGPPGPKPH